MVQEEALSENDTTLLPTGGVHDRAMLKDLRKAQKRNGKATPSKPRSSHGKVSTYAEVEEVSSEEEKDDDYKESQRKRSRKQKKSSNSSSKRKKPKKENATKTTEEGAEKVVNGSNLETAPPADGNEALQESSVHRKTNRKSSGGSASKSSKRKPKSATALSTKAGNHEGKEAIDKPASSENTKTSNEIHKDQNQDKKDHPPLKNGTTTLPVEPNTKNERRTRSARTTRKTYAEDENDDDLFNNDAPPPSSSRRQRQSGPSVENEEEFLEDTTPLEPPPPLPPFPPTQTWSFDPTTRVLLGTFTHSDSISPLDEKFMLQMMERTDITVISEGLVHPRDLNSRLWSLEYMEGAVGKEVHHRFREFEQVEVTDKVPLSPEEEVEAAMEEEATEAGRSRNSGKKIRTKTVKRVAYAESSVSRSMQMADFCRYLRQRESLLFKKNTPAPLDDTSTEAASGDPSQPKEETFCYVDHDGNEHSFDCTKIVLYLLDYDMVKLLPALTEDFIKNFRLPNLLPGGAHCMMSAVSPGGRPFMGPNLYLTPPSSFTRFHQDGHGTVDSGHQCLAGYNEVVMLRRMPEAHKRNALRLLQNQAGEEDQSYDPLYGFPHAEFGQKSVVKWPSSEAIQRCKEMNYCPSVFILKPFQFVHINKGRLHAFRKLSPDTLPHTDCHAAMRSALLQKKNLQHKEVLCISVAWDWTFRGTSSTAIHNEMSSVLECISLNRKHLAQSLAVPETSVLLSARQLVSTYEQSRRGESGDEESLKTLNALGLPLGLKPARTSLVPDAITILQGLLPSLQSIVDRHHAAYVVATNCTAKTGTKDVTEPEGDEAKDESRVTVAKRPDSWENPQLFTLDPYGNDFFCKLCGEELSNLYMHCDGCEILLNKDFNICITCHTEQRYKTKIIMHPFSEKKHSFVNHTGNQTYYRRSRCPCKNGPVCKNCSYCQGCSCKCHQWFTLRCRFMEIADEVDLAKRVKAAVESRGEVIKAEIDNALAQRPEVQAYQQLLNEEMDESKNSEGEQETPSVLEGKVLDAAPAGASSTREKPENCFSDTVDDGHFSDVDDSGLGGKAASKGLTHTSSNERGSSSSTASRGAPNEQDGESEFSDVAQEPVSSMQDESCLDDEPQTRSRRPAARDDVAPLALAYTTPQECFLQQPLLVDGGPISGLRMNALEDFIRRAKEIPCSTAQDLKAILPSFPSEMIHHLYRNFSDYDFGSSGNEGGINFSPREIYILSYQKRHKPRTKMWKKLMPYRSEASIRSFLAREFDDRPDLFSKELMTHIGHCVEVLLFLEEDG